MRIEVDASTIKEYFAPYQLVKTMRASILVLGPLLARFGSRRRIAPGRMRHRRAPGQHPRRGPAGDGRGHSHRERLHQGARGAAASGAHLVLETVTVTGTENLMMAAALADGETVLENAAREPEVVDLANFLIAHGREDQGRRHRPDRHRGRRAAARHRLRGAARPHRERHLSGRGRDHRRPRAHQEHAARASRRGHR